MSERTVSVNQGYLYRIGLYATALIILAGSSPVCAATSSDIPQSGTVVPRESEDAPPADSGLHQALKIEPAAGKPMSAEDLMNLPLDKLVNVEITSASKYAQKESEAPTAVEVISADDIRTFGYRTLGDAINGLHGLYTSSDGHANFVGQHEPYDWNARYLIMVDGVRMNNDVYDQVDTGQLFMLDMALVDHIEYIPGPGSSIYGANALNGVINVISKKGSDINGTQVAGSAGNLGAYTARATYGKTLSNGADVLLSASKYSTHGEKDLYFPEYNQGAVNGNAFSNGETNAVNNYGHAQNMDGGEDKHLFLKALYDDFTFTSGYVEQDHKAPADVYGNLFNDQLSHITDSTTYGDLKYNTHLNSKTQLEMEGYSQWFKRSLFVPYDENFGTPPLVPALQVNSAYSNWVGGEAKLVTTAFNRQKLVTGIEYQDDLRERLYATDTDACIGCYLFTSHGSRAGVYAQDDISLRDNLILSAGGRFDKHHMIKGMEFNPRLALVWNPQPDDTVKLLYGSAFRAPNVIEDVGAAGKGEAEHVKNYQLVDEWRPAPGVKYTGSLFYNNYKQVLGQDQTTGAITNNGRFLSYGYDFEAEKRWASGASVNVSFDHTIMYDAQNIWAINSPKNVAKAKYGQPLFGDGDLAKLGMEVVYVDARRTMQPGKPNAASYELVNANLTSKKIIPGADASFGVYNLLNEHSQFVGGNWNNQPPFAGYYAQNVLPLGSLTVEAMVQFKF